MNYKQIKILKDKMVNEHKKYKKESNKLEKDRDFVVDTLINLEKKLGRPILKEDISLEKTGFSLIVLNRMFGGLGRAKEELGLMKSI